jgi:hypothetical protein
VNDEFDSTSADSAAQALITQTMNVLNTEPVLVALLAANPQLGGHWTGSAAVTAQLSTTSRGVAAPPGKVTLQLTLTLQVPPKVQQVCDGRPPEMI